jgi:hypothetical protein
MKIQIIVFVPILFFQPILFLLNIQDHIFEASNLVMFHLFLLLYVKHWPANYDNISWHVNWLLFRIGPLFNFDVLVLFICFYSLRTLIVDVWELRGGSTCQLLVASPCWQLHWMCLILRSVLLPWDLQWMASMD